MHASGTPCRGTAISRLRGLSDLHGLSMIFLQLGSEMKGADQDLRCRPGLEPGPITPGEMFEARGWTDPARHIDLWLWVPAQGRDDTECDARIVANARSTQHLLSSNNGLHHTSAEPVSAALSRMVWKSQRTRSDRP
ncbi:hypothetical protein BRAO375_2390055 [Bradyrhizobium sp. ORS 375]|nr:hypothetical protein BRAO375_2390055 [Bradyrhizobium sp. ORS 375]